MFTVFSEKHALRDAKTELYGGQLVPPFECPVRAEYILDRLKSVKLGEVIAPDEFGLDPSSRIHDHKFLNFLEQCWSNWITLGYKGEAIPTVWPARGIRQRIPNGIEGRMGYYALAGETSISNGTWEAARASANVALTAQAFIDQGASRVAILDVDFHHGNGTQVIFYNRSDVMFLSLHGDPKDASLTFSDTTMKPVQAMVKVLILTTPWARAPILKHGNQPLMMPLKRSTIMAPTHW